MCIEKYFALLSSSPDGQLSHLALAECLKHINHVVVDIAREGRIAHAQFMEWIHKETTGDCKIAFPSDHLEVVASTFDEPAERHVKVSNIILQKAKRLVECGHS